MTAETQQIARKGPYRADHVGSLIRPDRLLDARAKRDAGEIDATALSEVEDDCIREVVRLQEDAGLEAITDGEFRRRVWYADFLAGFDNVTDAGRMLEVSFTGPDGSVTTSMLNGMRVDGKLNRSHGIQTESFEFLKAAAKKRPKVCIPSPSMMHFRGGREGIDRQAYPQMEAFWDDLARVYHEEIMDLVSHGLTYLQLDDTNLAYLCDENFRTAVSRIGEDPGALPATYCDVINRALAGVPDDVTVCIHLCRGNARQSGVAAGSKARGGYEPVAEELFGSLNVDGYFLEYDDERSGDFSPLRFLPKGKKVVLGLVTTKRPELESKDLLKRRIEEASGFVSGDQICLSPQCGFSSGVGRKGLTIDDERAKLSLVVELATEIWGGL
jgi:5-methyltetrahydropteroyltriglutamate--homocysteine methyltransferase